MADFEITAPDGSVYQITAPDEGAAMAAFDQMLGTQGAAPAFPSAPAAPDVPEGRGNFLDPMMQGLTFGAMDEMAAGVQSMGALFNPDETVGQAYDRNLADERANLASFQQRNPIGSTVAEVGGALLPAIATMGGGGLLSGANAATRIGGAGLAGAGGGAVAGFNSGEGGFGNRLGGAGTGAATGAAFGLGGGALVEGGARVAGAVGNSLGFGAAANARRAVSERVASDGIELAGVTTDKPVNLADLGEDTLSLAGRAFRKGGAKQEVRTALEGRSRGQYGRLVDDVDRAFETRGADFGARRKELMEGRAAEATELRKVAYAQAPPGLGVSLSKMVEERPTMRKVYEAAQRRAADRGRSFEIATPAPRVDEVGQRELVAAAKDQAEARELVARVQELQHETGIYRKRPATEYLKTLGGIDPTGPLAAELRHVGINPKDAPGLFKRGGMKSADNLPQDEMADVLGFSLAGDGAGYVDQESIIEALLLESRGAAKRSPDQEEALRELGQLLPDFDDALELAQSPTISTALPKGGSEVSVEGLHLMRQELDDRIGAAGVNSPSRVPELIELRDVIDERLKNVPEMKRFDLAYASDTQGLEAFERGAKFLRSDAFDTAQDVAELPRAQYDNFRLGVAKALLDKMAAKSDTGNAGTLFNNPATREKIQAVFKDQDEFAVFMERAQQEDAMQRTYDKTVRGPETAARIAEDGRELPVGAIRTAFREGIGPTIDRAIGGVTDRAQGRAGERANREMARLLLSPDIEGVSRELVAQRARDAKAREAMGRLQSILGFGSGVSAAGGQQ